MLRIPIDWRDSSGTIVSNAASFTQPFMSIEVSNPQLATWIPVIALVDTGLGSTSIHHDILEKLKCPRVDVIKLFGSAGWQDFPTFSGAFRFPDHPTQAGTAVFSAIDSPIGHSHYTGAIGMDILRLGRLVLEPQNGSSYFELP